MSLDIAVTDDLATCLALRHAVFVVEQGVSPEIETDEYDAEATHILACLDGRPVGSARMVRQGAQAKIGRVCVLPELRGTGLGIALMQAVLTELRDDPAMARAVLNAQCHALGFYERLGFVAYGPVFDDAGIPHQAMARELRDGVDACPPSTDVQTA